MFPLFRQLHELGLVCCCSLFSSHDRLSSLFMCWLLGLWVCLSRCSSVLLQQRPLRLMCPSDSSVHPMGGAGVMGFCQLTTPSHPCPLTILFATVLSCKWWNVCVIITCFAVSLFIITVSVSIRFFKFHVFMIYGNFQSKSNMSNCSFKVEFS